LVPLLYLFTYKSILFENGYLSPYLEGTDKYEIIKTDKELSIKNNTGY